MKKIYFLVVVMVFTFLGAKGQIISQYVETSSGTTPKGIEIWNNTARTLNFSVNNLVIQQGSNGGALSTLVTISSGTLAANAVIVIGTSDMEATVTGNGAVFVTQAFTFNGDDALAVRYGGTTTDVFGLPGNDPGTAWTGSGVSTANSNIQLKTGITAGDLDGWTDPSIRFETVSTDNSITGFGLAPISVPCSAPNIQASDITFSSIGINTMTVGWTNGDGLARIVVMNTTNSFTDPTDGTTPIPDPNYGGSGEQVVYNGNGNSVDIAVLSPATTYWYRVYEYNCIALNTKYNISAAANNPNSQVTVASCAAPLTQASGINFTAVAGTSMTINWTPGNGSKRIVIINTTNSFTDPVDGTDPSPNTIYSGSGEQVIYNNTGSSVSVTGLSFGTTYWYRVYEYNCSGVNTKFNTSTATDNPLSQATTAAPALGLQLTAANTNYVIDFDNTVANVNNGQYLGTGFTTSPVAGQLNSDAWATTGMSDGGGGFGGSYTTLDFARGTSSGGVGTGGYYAFTVSTGNSAFGIQPGGNDWTPGTLTLKVQNNTGSVLSSLGLAYKVFNFNDGLYSGTFNFSYSVDNVTYIPVSTVDFASIEAADGSPVWKAYLRSLSITGLTVANGDYIYLRWLGDDNGGSTSRDEFALDDISIVANPTTVYPSVGGNITQANITGNVQLSSNLTIEDLLALNGGKVFLGNNDLYVVNSLPAAVAPYSATSYVVTNGAGSFKRDVIENTGYTFPIGNTANLQLAQIDFTEVFNGAQNVLNTLSTRFINGASGSNGLPLGESGDNIQRTSDYGYWELNAQNPSPNLYRGTFTAKGFFDIIDYTKIHLVKRDNSASPWTLNGVHFTTTGSNSLAVLERTDMVGFSQFGVGGQNNVSLPVKFVDVSAAKAGSAIRIAWSNLTELNITEYVVERSANGQQFTAINMQNALRNDGGKASYSQIDASPILGVSYYRISAVEVDGKKFYSIIVRVDTRQSNTTDINLYPNPVRDGQFVMQIPELNAGKYNLQVFNAVGQQVITQTIEHLGGFAIRSVQLPTGQTSGVYTVVLVGENAKMTKAFLVQ